MIYQSLNPKCSETQFRWVKLKLRAPKLSAIFSKTQFFGNRVQPMEPKKWRKKSLYGISLHTVKRKIHGQERYS